LQNSATHFSTRTLIIKTVKVIATDGSAGRRINQRYSWRCRSAGMLLRVKWPSISSMPTSSEWSATSAKLPVLSREIFHSLCSSWREFVLLTVHLSIVLCQLAAPGAANWHNTQAIYQVPFVESLLRMSK
jgi:hypothetical protein